MTEQEYFSSGPGSEPDDSGMPLGKEGLEACRLEEPLDLEVCGDAEAGADADASGALSEEERLFRGAPETENSGTESFRSESCDDSITREEGALEPFGRETEHPDGSDGAAGRMRFLGVRMRRAGQVFFFPDNDLPARVGSKVIVELEHGTAFGEVDSFFYGAELPEKGEDDAQANARVVGLATVQDIARHAENRILSAEATAFCTTCIRQRSLDMKLVDVEVLHDRSKIIFYFTAPSRIDFRELVKDLVRNYRTRIELRQIGVRHETQMVGGLGNCGMVCCCHKYLRKFAPVTIKMAKEQNLFLNPAKLSGMCGRLLCCLSFEQSNYEEFNRRCPKLGKRYATTGGTFKVVRANMFNQSIVVASESGEESELTLEEWETKEPRRAEASVQDPQRVAHAQRPPADNGHKGRSKAHPDRGHGERKKSGTTPAEEIPEEARATLSDPPPDQQDDESLQT